MAILLVISAIVKDRTALFVSPLYNTVPICVAFVLLIPSSKLIVGEAGAIVFGPPPIDAAIIRRVRRAEPQLSMMASYIFPIWSTSV